VTAGNTDEYAAIGGLPTTAPVQLTKGQRMKKRGKTAYGGLIAVVQALSDCSDVFPPLKTACNAILTIHKTFDVRKIQSAFMRHYYWQFTHCSLGVRGCRRIEIN
jgi:hypothetical protein